MLGLNVKDMVIGGISIASLAGSTVNMVKTHKLKKRMNQTEAVLQKLAAIPAPQPAPQPVQPATGEQPKQ